MPHVSAVTLVTQPGMVDQALDFLEYLLGRDTEPIKVTLREGEGFDNETRLIDVRGDPLPTTILHVKCKDPNFFYYKLAGLRHHTVTHIALEDSSELIRHTAIQCLFLLTC